MTDLDGLAFIKRGAALIAADLHTEEYLNKIKDGGEIVLTKSRRRSSKQERWFRALVKKVYENLPEDLAERLQSPERLLDAIKISTGEYVWQQTILGGRYEHPNSIADMDHDKFNAWSKLATDVMSKMIGVDATTLMKETDRQERQR